MFDATSHLAGRTGGQGGPALMEPDGEGGAHARRRTNAVQLVDAPGTTGGLFKLP